MKTWLCLGVLALAACGKPEAPVLPPVVTTPLKQTDKPADTEKPADVQPRIYVTANDSDVPEIPAGWPLVLKASLHAPGGASLRIAAASGPWSSLVRLTLPEGPWKLRPVEITAPAIALDATTSGLLLWTMMPEELDAVPRGTYRFEAHLESRDSGDGAWSGAVRGSAAVVQLVEAIPRLTEEQDLERSKLLVTVLMRRGDAAAAERTADELLQRRPKHPRAILLRVDLLEAAGKRGEAIALLDRAIEAVIGPTPSAKSWPRDLMRRREELGAMEKE